MTKLTIQTERAPQPIGTYSQAVRVGETVYLSGQIGFDPDTMTLVDGGIECQIRRVFENLKAVAEAADGSLNNVVKLNIYLTNLENFGHVNEIMAQYFDQPYPARCAIGVSALPRNAGVEMDGIMILNA